MRRFKKAFKFNENLAEPEALNDFSTNREKPRSLAWTSWFRKGLEVPNGINGNLLVKERILEVYLNIAEFGNGIFGVKAASRYYFKNQRKI